MCVWENDILIDTSLDVWPYSDRNVKVLIEVGQRRGLIVLKIILLTKCVSIDFQLNTFDTFLNQIKVVIF